MLHPSQAQRPDVHALRRYELLSENTRDIVLFIGANGQILEANRAAVRAYGYSRSELLSRTIHELRAVPTRSAVPAQLAAARSGGITFETTHLRQDGTTFPVEVSSTPSEFGGMLLSLIRDITPRKRLETTQALLRQIDHQILGRERLDVILQTTCDCLATQLGYALVWIGLKRPDGSVAITTSSGEAAGFLQDIIVRWDESPEGLGPTGTAIRTGQPQCMNLEDHHLERFRTAVDRYGLRRGLSLPLASRGETLGALTLYSRDTTAFDEETIAHLMGFASQAAFSLLAARDQEQIRLQTAALEATANAVVITDRQGVIQWVNPAWCALTGYTAAEAIGLNPRILKSGRHPQDFYEKMWRTILSGQSWRDVMYNCRKDGSTYAEQQTITPVMADGKTITHFVAIKQEVPG